MRIKITTDSTCDLTRELLKANDIDVFPLSIVMGEQSLLDGIEILPEDIYRHVSAGGEITTTSAINVLDYLSYFSKLSPVYDAVVHVNIGSDFSSCHQNAVIAAENFSNVYAVDSRNLSSGQGLVALEAARLAGEGLSAKEIITALESFIPRVDVSFLLSQLDYLAKGGRCSSVAALGANLLRLKACIEVDCGAMRVWKKYRGTYEKTLIEYVRDRLRQSPADPRQVLVVHTACPPGAVESVCREVEAVTGSAPFAAPTAGCTICSHCGPCTLGIMYARK
ncbi:Fatty acid-binding protein [bioreactor metagenome]|uniref:Fatty acid-binding protein n=1 Tax=bioreactor metagenome TaxID=1076179 RepID=A0A644ZRC3_9ZZZZ